MKIGVPKEIKNHEYRVGLSPAGVRELTTLGHTVCVEQSAGDGIGFSDEDYIAAGARIVGNADAVFAQAELIVKVKEPQPEECAKLRAEHILLTYLHLAADKPLTAALMATGTTCIAYETVTDREGRLPLLAPMSEVAGRMAVQEGAHCLEKARGGSGVLLGGVPGVSPANVLILGGGVVGINAARMAIGMGANVTILDKNLNRLRAIDDQWAERITTVYSTTESIEYHLALADLVIGAVLLPGAVAPKLITRKMLSLMKPGSVLVDVAIDQGGCFETSRPTTHQDPIYTVDGIVHYCVANMPGGVARTSTLALTNATLPYVIKIAELGLSRALSEDRYFRDGLNVYRGKITCGAVAEALDLRSAYSQPNFILTDEDKEHSI